MFLLACFFLILQLPFLYSLSFWFRSTNANSGLGTPASISNEKNKYLTEMATGQSNKGYSSVESISPQLCPDLYQENENLNSNLVSFVELKISIYSITNYQKPNDLKQQCCITLQFWRLESAFSFPGVKMKSLLDSFYYYYS